MAARLFTCCRCRRREPWPFAEPPSDRSVCASCADDLRAEADYA